MEPSTINWELGCNIYGQPIELIRSKDSNNAKSWSIYRGQADQRDDSQSVNGLTTDIINRIADIVKGYKA